MGSRPPLAAQSRPAQDPALKARLADLNMTDLPQNTPPQFIEQIRAESATWSELILGLNLQME